MGEEEGFFQLIFRKCFVMKKLLSLELGRNLEGRQRKDFYYFLCNDFFSSSMLGGDFMKTLVVGRMVFFLSKLISITNLNRG